MGGKVKGESTWETKLLLSIQNTKRGWTSTRSGLGGSSTLEHPKEPKGMTEEEKQDLIAVYRSLTDEDWDYIIGHTHWGMAKWGLNQAREKYGRK